MKTIILAGGYGTRISEESHLKPKPMIEIGGQPILWHIMKIYSAQGFNDFIICCGYKQSIIKEYFADYYLHTSDVTFDYADGKGTMTIHDNAAEPWRVTVVDTGLATMTGGRVKRVRKYIDDEPFFLTYGDGVSDVDLKNLLKFHERSKKTLTLTAINPGQRFGVLSIGEDDCVSSFHEKNQEDGGFINGGFMVANPSIFDYIEGDETVFERGPMETLAERGELMAYRHHGFWHCMDTARDKEALEKMWASGNAPWRIW